MPEEPKLSTTQMLIAFNLVVTIAIFVVIIGRTVWEILDATIGRR